MALEFNNTESIINKEEDDEDNNEEDIKCIEYVINNVEYMSKRLQELIWKFKNGGDVTEDYIEIRDYITTGLTSKLYSRFKDNSTLKEFMLYGILNISKEQLVKLIMNIENRKDWDETYIEHEMLDYYNNSNTDIIFSVSKFPFPLSKRTYVLTRTLYNIDDGYTLIFSKSIKHDFPKKYKWATHVDDFESLLMLKNFEPEINENGNEIINKCNMLVTYYENPKVLLPNSYLNFIIGHLVPGILSKMVIAAKKQDPFTSIEYCKQLKYITIPNKIIVNLINYLYSSVLYYYNYT